MSITTSDMDVWFSTTGSDTTGTGTEGNPYATYDKAMSTIPDIIDHKVCVHGKAGAYTSTRTWDKRECTRNGQFILEGADEPTEVSTHTVRAVTTVGIDATSNSGWNITAVSPGWTTDCLYRHFIQFTSGEFINHCYPIYSNTTDTIKMTGSFWGSPAVGDTFRIIKPSTSIEFTEGATFTWVGHTGKDREQFAICNIIFNITTDMSGAYTGGPFVWDGNGNTAMALTEFYGNGGYNLFSMSEGLINCWWYVEDGSQMENESILIPDHDLYYVCPSIQFVGTDHVPTSSDLKDVIMIDGCMSHGWPCGIEGFACRQGIYIESKSADLEYAMFAYVIVDHAGNLGISNCRLSPMSGTSYTIRCDDFSTVGLADSWVDNCSSNAILLTDGAKLLIVKTGGTTAAISGYGVLVGALCQVRNEGNNTTLEGTSGKIRLTQSDTTVAWPTAKTSYNDGMGSFVTG